MKIGLCFNSNFSFNINLLIWQIISVFMWVKQQIIILSIWLISNHIISMVYFKIQYEKRHPIIYAMVFWRKVKVTSIDFRNNTWSLEWWCSYFFWMSDNRWKGNEVIFSKNLWKFGQISGIRGKQEWRNFALSLLNLCIFF